MLLARIKAQLRRYHLQNKTKAAKEQKQLLKYPGLEIDLEGHTVLVDGSPVPLAAKEYEILVLLAQNPNRVFRKEQLLAHLWESKYNSDDRTLMVHVSRLRKKIEKDPSNPIYLLTVRGVGYKFNSFKQ